MQPIKNQIVFKPFIKSGVTQGGLFVPDSYRNELDKGEIVKVGKGTKERPMPFKPGDIAYRVHNWGTPYKEKEETFYLMDSNAILALEKNNT